ncbi:MAG: hypothetical protein CMM90_01050 [Rickettsiales bacterium]|nr:hypothetical protein [Rickettsiales bacterium]|tara:strand:- start:3875 stop:4648 length:774 start_codon:yes stop_codon:yes gene_type:complete
MFKLKFQNIEMISNKKKICSKKFVLFFYGLGCCSSDLDFLLKKKFLNKQQILIFDLPGHNYLNYKYETLSSYVRKIYLFIIKNNIQNITFFAHSVGGIIPILLMKEFLKNKVKVSKFFNYEGNLTEADTETLTKKTISYSRNDFASNKFSSLIKKCEQSDKKYLNLWSKSLKKTSSYAFYDLSFECVKFSMTDELFYFFRSFFKKKVYLIGEKSKFNKPELYFGSVRFKIKNSGHFSYFENRREFGKVFEQLILKNN